MTQNVGTCIIAGWPSNYNDIKQDEWTYKTLRDELAMINGTTMKGKIVIIPAALQSKISEQVHSNNLVMENTRLLVRDSVNWVKMNAGIEDTVKNFNYTLASK